MEHFANVQFLSVGFCIKRIGRQFRQFRINQQEQKIRKKWKQNIYNLFI